MGITKGFALILVSAIATIISANTNADTNGETNSKPSEELAIEQLLCLTESSGRLTARPIAQPDGKLSTGLHHLYLDTTSGRDGSIYVPQNYRHGEPAPLLLVFHGNRGDKSGELHAWRDHAEKTGTILLIPESRLRTWDRILNKEFNSDYAFVDQALKKVFQSLSINKNRMAIAGFSDGASYALALGLTNGDMFSHIAAFSPGSANPAACAGKPPVFIIHGVQDDILDINKTSRVIYPALRSQGYNVTYFEFQGQHLVTEEGKAKFFAWFLK